MGDKEEKEEYVKKVLWDLSFIVASLYEVMNNLINHQQASPVILKEVKENIIKLQNKLRGKEE